MMLRELVTLASLGFAGCSDIGASRWPDNPAAFGDKVASGAQCRYANGEKAMLLRMRSPRNMVLVIRDSIPRDTLIHFTLDERGGRRFEANGGVTMYRMVDIAFDDLVARSPESIPPGGLDAFLARTDIAPCRRATFEADLYEGR